MTGPRGRGRGRGGGRPNTQEFGEDDEAGGVEPEIDPDLARTMNAANRVRFDKDETTGRFQARAEFLQAHNEVYGLMRENTTNYMQLPDHLIGCMGATGKGFVTMKNSYMNTEKVCMDSSPGIHFVQEMLSPHPPKCLKVLSYLSNCINSMDNLNGCVVPTPFTDVLVQNKKVIGINHVSEEASKMHRTRSQMTLQELMRYQVAVETEDLMTVKNKENVVECVCRMVPAKFQDNQGKFYYRLFMVCSLIGRSGVDLLSCIRKITDPLVYTNAVDKDLAISRRVQWNAVWLEELHICERDAETGNSMCIRTNIDFDNEFDPQHPLLYCSELMVIKKIDTIIYLEQEKLLKLNPQIQFSELEVYGMPQPRDEADMIIYQKCCHAYCDRIREHRMDYRKASEHFYFGLKSGKIPDVKYNLRHVYGLVLSTEHHGHMDDLSFGYMEAPMTMVWRPLNPLNSHESWDKFDTGQLPLTARILTLDFQAGAVEMNESVLSDDDKLPAMEILRWNRYYCAMRDPLLEYVRPNCYKVWKQGIMHKLVSMMDEANGQVHMDALGHVHDVDERKLMYITCRKVVERARMYITQAARWHMAQIEVGEYRSDSLQCGAVVLKAYRNDLPAMMKKVWEKHGQSAPDSRLFSLSMQMRHTFYRCCLSINKYASMSYANMEIFTQVFTTDMLWHFGHNESWTTFCQCIQVVTLKDEVETVHGAGKTDYFTRPLHDDALVSDESPQYMSCTIYKTYCPEDLLHMTHVVAAMKYFKIPHIGMLPLDLVCPRYNMLYDVFYPLIRLRDTYYHEGCDISDVSLHGYVRTYIDEATGTPVFQIFASYYDSSFISIPDVDPVVDCFTDAAHFNLTELDKSLSEMQLLVGPLIRRHSAVVYCGESKKFGVVMPIMDEDGTSPVLDGRGDCVYFNPDEICYTVFHVGDSVSTSYHPLQLEACLLGLGKNIYIRSSVLSRFVNASDITVSLDQSPVEYITVHVRYAQQTPDTIAGFRSITVCVQKQSSSANDVDMISVTIPITQQLSHCDFLIVSDAVDASHLKIISRI
ncbi:hypothetical protein T484DRAFT_1757486 [Baffinella frigidus]|nr:hypothetical protein T484DRAFT_1757486 [Cryptophyta sp. CCMP2293]